MQKLWDQIKKLKWWIIGCIVFLAIVQILYTIPAPCRWLEAKYEAGDLISFVGTIVLGVVAIIQTKEANEQAKVANDMSNRLMGLEESRYKLEIRPFVMLKNWNCFFEKYYGIIHPDKLFIQSTHFEEKNGHDPLCVALDLLNTTQSYISVQFSDVKYVDDDKPIFEAHSYANTPNITLRLNSGESGSIVFWGENQIIRNALNHRKVRFSFVLENRFGERYQEDFDAVVIVMDSPTKEDAPFVVFSTSNYKIGKFINNSEGEKVLVWEETDDGQA